MDETTMHDETRMVRELYGEAPPVTPQFRARTRNRLTDAARGGRGLRFPRPALLLAGVTTAGALAVGGVVVLSDSGGAGPAVTATSQTPADAQSFLLASAQKAERAPATAGRYWYTRVRTADRVVPITDGEKAPRERNTAIAARKPKSNGNARKLAGPAYPVTISHTQDSWTARDAGDRARTIVGIDRKYAFAAPADEAKWKAEGSPQLSWVPAKPKVNNYDEPMRFTIGQKQLTMRQLVKLPTDAAALGTELRRRYQADVNDPKYPLEGSYLQYVWATAQDLLAGPITPGTKAALYRVLAEQKGIRMVGKVTDSLGRPGVALAFAEARPVKHVGGQGSMDEYRLIIDPQSAELLAYEARGKDKSGQSIALLSMAYQSMGWVNGLNESS